MRKNIETVIRDSMHKKMNEIMHKKYGRGMNASFMAPDEERDKETKKLLTGGITLVDDLERTVGGRYKRTRKTPDAMEPTKSAKSRGDGGTALAEFRRKVDLYRKKTGASYREAQKAVSQMRK